MTQGITVKNKLITGLSALFLLTNVQAGTPLWTITPSGGSSPNIPVSSAGTATIQYQVTNMSPRSHTLQMKPITGISASGCTSILPSHQSCTLTLQVQGSLLSGDVLGGPIVCDQGNPNQCYRPSQGNELNIHLTQQPPVITYTVTPSGDGLETISPSTAVTVNAGASPKFTVIANAGYTLAQTVGGTCTPGSWNGNIYTTGAITNNCSVTFGVTVFPAAAGPINVTTIPGNGQVTVSWNAPTNIGGGVITGYTVIYGQSISDQVDTAGCTTNATTTSCTISGLTNGTAYTFAVTTQTTKDGGAETGPRSYSSPVKPTPGSLVATQSSIAVRQSGNARSIRIINTSNSGVNITSVITNNFPAGTVLLTPASACTANTTIPAGGSCTITIQPGPTVSSDTSAKPCTSGIAPTNPGQVSIGGPDIGVDVFVVDYGCQYQGGYLFSIDDNTPTTASIGGAVLVFTPTGLPSRPWSPSNNSIWGIDDTSTTSTPSPSAAPTLLQPGQLNCDGMDDGSCNSNNIFVYPNYGNEATYAVGICSFAEDNTGNACSGNTCYTDLYLPSLCELNSENAAGISNCVPGTASIASNLSILYSSCTFGNNCLSGAYWSSTEYSNGPLNDAWAVSFPPVNTSLTTVDKSMSSAFRCARKVTI